MPGLTRGEEERGKKNGKKRSRRLNTGKEHGEREINDLSRKIK